MRDICLTGFVRLPLMLVIGGYFVVGAIGALLIAPTGPGSGLVLWLCLFVYSVCIVIIGQRAMKMLSFALACLFLVGAVRERRARTEFLQKLKERHHIEDHVIGATSYNS
jgi:hypothetical protein